MTQETKYTPEQIAWILWGKRIATPAPLDKMCCCGHAFSTHYGEDCPTANKADAAMIARDGPSIHITENGVAKVKAKDVLSQPQVRKDLEKVKELRTTHANPFAAFRSPDFTNGPADHLNAARHQMAGMKG